MTDSKRKGRKLFEAKTIVRLQIKNRNKKPKTEKKKPKMVMQRENAKSQTINFIRNPKTTAGEIIGQSLTSFHYVISVHDQKRNCHVLTLMMVFLFYSGQLELFHQHVCKFQPSCWWHCLEPKQNTHNKLSLVCNNLWDD